MNTENPITLIQLVSGQTIQNLLLILRLKPTKIISLATPRTAAQCKALEKATHAAGIHAVSEVIPLSEMPEIKESELAVQNALQQHCGAGSQAVLNFTGGTKLMSIGAIRAAEACGIPSVYIDTQGGRLIDGRTAGSVDDILHGDWSFTSVLSQMSVDIHAMANGVERVDGGRDWAPYHALAQYLFNHPEEEEMCHQAIHGKHGLCPHGREPRTSVDWLKLIEREIELPEAVVKLAVQADLLRQGSAPTKVRLPNESADKFREMKDGHIPNFHAQYFAAIEPLQQAMAFLTGAWWELIVLDAARASGRFRDLRWSVNVGKRGGAQKEEDILGVDGVQLLMVSCKRGGAKSRLLPLLEEIRARAETIGGTFNRRFLAVYHPPKNTRTLVSEARRHGVTLITHENVYDPAVFNLD